MSHKIKHAFKNVLDELYSLGKNTKKGEIQRQMKKLTKRRESHFIHASTTKVRYERAAMAFCDYLESLGIKRNKQLMKMKKEELQKIVDNYFKQMSEKKRSKSTIKVHIAMLQKTLAILRPDIKKYLEDDENRIRWWSAGVDSRKRDSYINPEKIRERLSEINKMIAEAQSLGGFRIREIAKAEVDKESFKVTIHKAKGGRTRELFFTHRKEYFERLAELVERLKEQHYEKHLKDYYRDLKNACKAVGEEYRASHAFRFEYAQRRIQELQRNEEERKELLEKYKVNDTDDEKKDKNDIERQIEQESDKVLTQELGHNRTSMSRYYYR